MIRSRVVLMTLAAAAAVWWFAPQPAAVVVASVHGRDAFQQRKDQDQPVPVLPPIATLDAKIHPIGSGATKLFAKSGPATATEVSSRPVVEVPVLPPEFQVIGKAQIDGVWKAIISIDGKSHLAGSGEKLANRFVVEKLQPPNLIVIDLAQGGRRFDLSVGGLP